MPAISARLDEVTQSARDLLAIFECTPLAQLLLRPDDPAFTMLAASDVYLQLCGVTRDDIVGRGLFEVFPDNPDNGLASGSRSLLASLRRVLSAKVPDKIPTFRYDIALPDGKPDQFEERYWNTRNAPVLNADGSVGYILHLVEDVTEKVFAEGKAQATQKSLQATEKRFQQLAEASDLGVLIGDGKGIISYANPALLRLLEYTAEEVERGLLRWDQLTPAEYLHLDQEAIRKVRDTGKCPPYEKVYLTRSGRRVPVLVGASLLEPLNGKTDVAAFVLDLTERKQSQRDALLVRLDDAIRPLDDPDEIMRTAAGIMGRELGADGCAYCTYNADQENVDVAAEYLRPGIPSLLGRYPIMQFGSELGGCLLANVPFVSNDVDSEPNSAEVRAAYRQVGVRALAVMPMHKAGRLVAAMGVISSDKPRTWLAEEVELVRAVTNRCWESIERARVTRELQASEQRLGLAQRAARIGSFEWRMQENRVIWSPELEALYGLPQGGFEGTFDDWRKRVVPADGERVTGELKSFVARRECECCYEFRAVMPDGTLKWLRGQAQFSYNEAGEPTCMIGVNFDITAQKKAEADLRHSEERLRAIYDGTFEYMGLLSPGGILLDANRASLEFASNTRDDVLGKLFWETPWFTATPGAPEAVKQAVVKAANGESVRFEATLIRPNGETPTFDMSFQPICNAQGEVVLIVPEGRDITERKLAEDRLQHQWEIFDTALSNSPDLTYTFDVEGRFTYANRKLCIVSQRTLKDTVGRTPAQLGYPPELASRIRDQIKQVVETKQGLRDQTPFRLPTGEIREYEYIYAPVIGENGLVRAVAGATRDVTERKEAEEQLRRSEAQFRQLFDALPQLVWSSSPEGYDDLYNKQWFEYTGLSYEEVQGDGSKIIHPEDLPAALARWKHSLQTGEPYEIEYRCRRFDGQYRWFLGRARPVRDEQGKVVRWFGTCTDIHDKKESETALRKAHKELEEFSYVASHDLQEPLRMVSIYTHLILRELGAEEGKMELFAGFVRAGVSRMETLLRDLMTFSQAVHTEAPVGVADLPAALAEALAVLNGRIEDSGAVVTAVPLPKVCGDTQQIAHVFQNLLSNALKYRKKDRAPEIHVSVTRQADQWTVSVRDNGIGFEPQYSERIFGLFKRLHKDEYPGTGLGLAICQRIVERYGGRMWAEGRPGDGATFYFSLVGVHDANDMAATN
jgi:PAS domain S-box-containing protein